MDNKKTLVFKIIHENWGMIGPGDWENTTYEIYSDLTLEKKIKYVSNKNISERNVEISINSFNKLKKLFEEARNVNEKVSALDGDAWEFIYYKDGNIYWHRNLDYTYGIEKLEKIQRHIRCL